MKYDVAIVGGGPAGYSAALKGAQLGAKVVLFERNKVGGTCLNVGCIPTKCYVAQAEFVEQIRNNTKNGIFKEAGLFSFKKIFAQKEKVVAQLTGGVGALLRGAGVTVVEQNAVFRDKYTIEAGGKVFETKTTLLATGSKNFVPPIPGIDGKNVLDSTSLLALDKLPKSIIIVGTGVIGLEFACILNTFGCKVTAVDILPEILPSEDREAADALYRSLKQSGIRFELGSKVTGIEDAGEQKKVTIEREGAREELTAQYVLVSVGRAPVNETAKQLGVALDAKGFVVVDKKMRTSVKDIYAAGDLIGGYLLAHSAYAEAETAVANCLGGEEEAELDVMPRCIFTMPVFAAVGNVNQEGAITGKFPFVANGKALVSGKGEGFVKWSADPKTGRLLGCTILGGEGAEMISTALVAINKKATIEEFEKMIFPHPTLSESVREAALDTVGHALHIPARK